MGTMLLHAVMPLSSSDLRRLVIRTKDATEGDRASGDRLRSALPAGCRVWILECGDGLEIICKVADYKGLRKALKAQRKEMAFSLDKKEDEHLSPSLFHRVLEQEMYKALASRGWIRLKEDLVRSSLKPSEDGKPVLAAEEVSIHLSEEKKLVLLCKPSVFKFFHLDVLSLLPAKLRDTLESSGRVCLTDWLECLAPEEQQCMRCLQLPSLETGWVTGVSKAGSSSQDPDRAAKDSPLATPEQLLYDVRGDGLDGVSSTTPATWVLRAGGIVPAPFLQRQAHIGSVLTTLMSDLRLDLLGAGTLELQASGEQPKTVTFDDAWTTAGSGMRSHPQLQSAQPLSLNIKEGGAVGSLWRRARPEPLLKQEDTPGQAAGAAKLTDAGKTPSLVLRTAPLLVPKFGPRASKGSSNKRKPEWPVKARGPEPSKQIASKVSEKPGSLPGAAPKKATVPAISKPKAPAAKKAKTSSDAVAKKAEAQANGGVPKGGIQKPPAKKPEGSATAGDAPKPPAKKPEAKESNEDVDAQVREKFAAGKLKDITLPRLKQFISSHKLGKVGGKKEVLMATVEAFLGRKEP